MADLKTPEFNPVPPKIPNFLNLEGSDNWMPVWRFSESPGTFDKRFVMNLDGLKPMTEKGRAFMITCLHKYRRQIPNYEKLNDQLHGQTTI